MKKTIKTIVALVLIAGLAVGGYFLYKNFDVVKAWFNDLFNPPQEQQTEAKKIEDWTFEGSKIKSYTGDETIIDNIPTQYSRLNKGVVETIDVTYEMTTSPEFEEIGEKVELSNGFYCTFNGAERTYFNSSNEWNTYVGEHYSDPEDMKNMFPFKLEFCDVIFVEGDDYQIDTIGSNAFSQNETITKVVLPETITIVESSAFQLCSNLTEINLTHVTSIGNYAFQNSALTNVEINENVTALNSAFHGCSDLIYVLINSSLLDYNDVTSLTMWNEEIKIYVPDQYYLDNYSIFSGYKDNIFPINGTYPEHEILTINYYIDDELYTTDSVEYDMYEIVIENYTLPNLEFSFENGKLFRGWQIEGTDTYFSEAFSSGNINLLIPESKVINFNASYYNIPLVEGIEQNTNINEFEIKSEIELFEIPQVFLELTKTYNCFEYDTFEELSEDVERLKTYIESEDYLLYISGSDDEAYGDLWTFVYTYEELIEIIETKEHGCELIAPITIHIVNYEYYDFTEYAEGNARNEILELLRQRNEIFSTGVYETYFNLDLTNATALETIIIPNNEGYVYVHLNNIENTTNLKEIVINKTDRILNLTTEGTPIISLNSNVKIYVPDELYEEYLASEYWVNVSDQIYKLSERTSL